MSKSNKTVIITGSGTGIGQSVARKFAKQGYNVIIMGRRKDPLIEASQILNNIIKEGGYNSIVKYYSGIDVANEDDINHMFEQIKNDFGTIDVVVNNAGVSGPVKIFTNSNFSDFKECVAIHLTGTFWTSLKSLGVLQEQSNIITISTFFTEENKFEQRPYRFRTPYTAAQGAKNRLTEALAWELVEKKIKSIGTNPGPVHSDRIYKTVYPKAAAEFLRIGGFERMTSKEIEDSTQLLLPLLGEEEKVITGEIEKFSKTIFQKNNLDSNLDQYKQLLLNLLHKIQEIAEKVQNNTKKMIVDNEFLAQDDVAEMVYTLSAEKISKMLNGKVIPNDRVFYPVKPSVNKINSNNNNFDEKKLKDNLVLITTTSSNLYDLDNIRKLAEKILSYGVRQIIILSNKNEISNQSNEIFNKFHHHNIDLSSEETIRKIFNTIETHFGKIDTTIHFTGSYNYGKSLISFSRKEWDILVDNFINIPHLITRESILSMATREAINDPSKFKDAHGNMLIVGPDSPTGKKIEGKVRARAEVFRGALRPYVTTANQELHDVLNSKINLTLLLQGNIEGQTPTYEELEKTIVNLSAQRDLTNQTILYVNE
ncbi:MAG: SDR family NAD(P)-dependent oxidoreductase [Thermoproteota archaeon]|nr:SDR family NAD(P)-dependent oxidoreductase [Thermoproteota archaeon]